jgi:hypothetical protein
MSRLAPLNGVAFVILLVAHASIAAGGLPSTDAPAEDVVGYVTDKQGEIQVGVVLQGIAMIAYLWFFACLFQRLRSSERGPASLSLVAVAGAITSLALLGVHISLMTVLALRGAELHPDVVTFAWVLAFLVLGMSSFTSAASMLAVGILILRSPTLPGWLGVVALVDAALALVGGVSAASTAGIWGAFGFAAFLLSLGWTASTSIVLLKNPESGAPTRTRELTRPVR